MAIRIRTKIVMTLSSIFLIFAVLGLMTYYNRGLLFQGMLDLERDIDDLRNLAELQLAVDQIVMPANDYLISGDVREMGRFSQIMEEVERRLNSVRGLSGETVIGKGMREGLSSLKRKAEEIFATQNSVSTPKEAVLMYELDSIASEIIVNHLGRYYTIERDRIAGRIVLAEGIRKRVDWVLILGGGFAFITCIISAVYLIGSLLTPIRELERGVCIVGAGNLDYRVDVRDGVEMNLFADEFNKMAERLKASYSDLEKKVDERTRELNELNKRLEELSITDGLTGLYNHRHFYLKIEEEMKRAERYGHPLSLIIADIDHFKHYNDTHGHPAGDALLKGISSCIKGNARGQDLVARYGGEEFSIILPETGKEAAVMVAERIRRCVSGQPFPYKEPQPGGNLTISLGVATFPVDSGDVKGLVDMADSALYRAKEGGRNRVESQQI